jgi:biopolymer transport protein ExbB
MKLLFILIICFTFNSQIYSKNLSDVSGIIDKQIIEFENKLEQLYKNISIEKQKLNNKIYKLEKSNQKINLELLETKTKNKYLENIKNELTENFNNNNNEMVYIENSLKSELQNLVNKIDLTVFNTEIKQFFLNDNIESVINNIIIKYLNNSAKIFFKNKVYFDINGNPINNNLLFIGNKTVFYKKNNTYGILQKHNNILKVPDFKLDSIQQNFIKNYYINNSEIMILPIDISNNKIFKIKNNNKTFISHIKKGGFFVYPILIIGIISIFMFVERIIFIIKNNAVNTKLYKKLYKELKNKNFDSAVNICKKNKSFISEIFLSVIKKKDSKKNIIEDIALETFNKYQSQTEKFQNSLKVFAAISPLLGLLGTVTGMITTFDVISIFGKNDPILISGGISEALITTELGLIVAIPILLMHTFICSKIDKLINNIEININETIHLIKK